MTLDELYGVQPLENNAITTTEVIRGKSIHLVFLCDYVSIKLNVINVYTNICIYITKLFFIDKCIFLLFYH